MTKYTEDQEKIIAKYESDLSFTDRASYVHWRGKWRTEYNELTREIRALRRTIVEKMKAGEYAGREQYSRDNKRTYAFYKMMERTAASRKSAKLRAAAIAEKAAA